MSGSLFYIVIIGALFVLTIVLFVHLEKLLRKVKLLRKALKRLEGAPEPLDEPAEWL